MELKLIKSPISYKMVITKKVEKKIRFLCSNINNIEWSGVLFYKVSGSFEDKSLKIICVDILQMDEGNSVFTEYNMSPDVIEYMTDNPNLLNCYLAHVHSHHSMSTNPSVTDMNTLCKEGTDTNHFVSLIVNNAGNYTAMITRKLNVKYNTQASIKYNTWEDKAVEYTEPSKKEDTFIEYSYLDIEVERDDNDFEKFMKDRINAIRNNKKKDFDFLKPDPSKFEIKFPEVPKTNTFKQTTTDKNIVTEGMFDSAIDWAVNQTLTCNVLISKESNLDLQKVLSVMDKLYSRRFKNGHDFEYFALNFADYVINTLEEYIGYEGRSSEIASGIKEKLVKLSCKYSDVHWIKEWCLIYDNFIVEDYD